MAHPTGSRSSNFAIGSDEPNMAKHSYESEFKQQYPEYPTQGRTAAKRLNDENNIIFGFDGERRDTNYKQEFPGKEGDRGQVVNQKLVHVSLGDALSDFSTSYKNNFDGAQADPLGQVANKSRDSNLVFGFGGTGYQTSNHSAHDSKPVAASKPIERTYGNNILMGADPISYHSEQKAKFAHKEADYQTVDKERVRDFKKAHFQMGFPEGQ